MEGESPLFRRGGSLPPNLPLSPRTSPISPPLTKRKVVSLSESGGDLGEVFCRFGRCGFVAGCGYRTLFVGGYVSRVYLARVPLTSNIHPMRNDTWVVPYNISFPMDYALCRGAIQRERPANYPALRPSTNLTHFYPVAERNGKPLSKSRSTGFGSEQPEFAAWNTATPKSAQTKRKREKPLCDEGLEGS